MRCPYCVSDIHDEALVCPACQRDLYLFRPLLSRIEALETRVDAQAALLDELQQYAGAASEAESGETGGAGAAASGAGDEAGTWPALPMLLRAWLLPLLLLIVAHGLIAIVYDLNTLYLRIVSLLIPLPFGLQLTMRHRCPDGALFVLAGALSICGVLAMSGANAIVDGTAILPVGLREWREFAEYSASISLSYLTGAIIGNLARRRAKPAALRRGTGMSLALAQLVTSGAARTHQIENAARKFHDLGSSLTAAATTAGAIFTGLQGFLGN